MDLIGIFTQWKKSNGIFMQQRDQRKLYMDLRKFLSRNKQQYLKNPLKENAKNTSPKQQSRQNSTRHNNPRSLSKQLQCIHTAEKSVELMESCKNRSTRIDRPSSIFKFHTSSGQLIKDVPRFEESIIKQQKKWTEEEIVKKYADLFTAPDFLKKHRAISQDTDPDSKDLNMAISCQSFVCQPKYYALQQFTAEQIFSYVFSEATLLRISRNFFYFKMEAFYKEIKAEQPDLQEMFLFIDKQNDGFIDVNEMGQFLEFTCCNQNLQKRQAFHKLDPNHLGYFTEQQMLQVTRDRQLTRNYFVEIDLLGTGKITYWEYYLKQSTEVGLALSKILI